MSDMSHRFSKSQIISRLDKINLLIDILDDTSDIELHGPNLERLVDQCQKHVHELMPQIKEVLEIVKQQDKDECPTLFKVNLKRILSLE
jgi:hypothetical protein